MIDNVAAVVVQSVGCCVMACPVSRQTIDAVRIGANPEAFAVGKQGMDVPTLEYGLIGKTLGDVVLQAVQTGVITGNPQTAFTVFAES